MFLGNQVQKGVHGGTALAPLQAVMNRHCRVDLWLWWIKVRHKLLLESCRVAGIRRTLPNQNVERPQPKLNDGIKNRTTLVTRRPSHYEANKLWSKSAMY